MVRGGPPMKRIFPRETNLQRMFRKHLRDVAPTIEPVTACPKCGSVEIGIALPDGPWDCADCGHVWPLEVR